MPNVWTITGQAGKALNTTSRSLESLNATGARLTFRNLAADTLTFSIPLATLASTAEIVPELGQTLALWRDGARIFHGHVTGRRQSGRSISITVSGPWWWLERIFLESPQTDSSGTTAERPTLAFPAQDLTTSLLNLANKAIALGVPMGVGSLATTFQSPPMRVNQMSYAGAMADLVRVTPDMVLYYDYSFNTPRLNTQRRLYAPGQFLDARQLERFELNPVTELEVSQVKVPFMTLAANGKKQFAVQTAGTAALGKVYLHIVSGAEMDTFLPADATIAPGSTVGIKTMSADNFTQLAKMLDPTISALFKKYGDVPGSAQQKYKVWGTDKNNPVFIKPYYPSKCITSGGKKVNLTGKYVLLSKDIPDWAAKQLGAIKVTYSGTWHAYFAISNPVNIDEYANAPQAFKDLVPGSRVFLQGWSPKPRPDISVEPGYVYVQRTFVFTATLVTKKSATLAPVVRGADYSFRFPPAGYAAGLLAAQNYVPYEGSFTVVADDAGGTRYMASAINFTNSQPEHINIRAMVSEEQLEIATGKTTVRLGPPARFSYRELVNRVRTNANDQIIYL